VTVGEKFKIGIIVSVLNIAIADCKDLICETKDNKLSDIIINSMSVIQEEKEKIRKVKDEK
jgi:hypothetical protein